MLKSFILSFFGLFILFINTALGQVRESKSAIKNEVMVRMLDDKNPTYILKSIPQHFNVKIDRVLSPQSDIWLLKFDTNQVNLETVIAEIKKVRQVLYVQPNREIELRAAPNDPLYSSQWQHENIDSELAWEITTGGQTPSGHDIVVALIESADIINHDDLKDNRWINTAEIPNNGIDDDGNGYIDDYNGWNVSTQSDDIGAGSHGTSCAGMIGAKGNNNQGVSGINWDIKIMDIAGYANPYTEANIIEAYNYALSARELWNQTNGARGAFVVATSASWGSDGSDPNDFPIWCSYYDDLGMAGILNVGATTNQDQDVDIWGDVPTGCASDYMIGVTASNQFDVIDFAGYGNQTINVAAPGSGIYTTASNNGYTSTSGTSFACPLTAGLIGLMYSIPCSDLESMAISNPQSTADIVRNALYDGVDQNNHLIARTISGGRINAKNSLDLLMADVCNSCSIPSNIATNVINENDAHITFDIEPITDSVKLSIQVAGSGNWNEHMITGNSFTIPSLLSCTNYEYYLTAYCQNEISTQSITKAFTTSGCGNCIDLNYCNALAVNPATSLLLTKPASISGNYAFTPTSNFGGDIENGYNYGELILVDDGTANSNEGCAPLINAPDINGNIAVVYRGSCNFTDKVLNAQDAGALAVIVINNVSTAPIEMGGTNNSIIIPAVMISQSDGTILMNAINNGDNPEVILGKQSEWNESFEINGQQFTTGNNNGYYFNDFTIQLSRNTTNSFTLTPGFEGQPLEVYYKIWLDENQDGVFDNTEIIYDQVTPATSSITDLFTVPPTAQLGKTRMRIQMSFQGYNTLDLPDVCGSFNSGEIEDYCVNITSGNICGMSVTSSVNNPTCQGVNDGSIALNVTGVNGPYTYTWNNGSTSANINNLSADNLFVNISDQNTCDTTIYFELNFEKELTLSETIVLPSCPNLADGSIDVHASGSSNFTYQWVNGPSNNLWNNIGMGTYDIIVTDFEGCSITKNYSLQNSQNPNPTLIADFNHDNQDLNVNFINNSINGSSYIWNFGDGNSSTQIIPSHTYPQEGTYEVCLKVQSSCDTVNLCKAIEVFEQEAALSNNSKNTTIKIYPNPASEQIIINKGASQAEKAFIYNTIGALIEVYDLRDVNTSLDLNQLNSGIYFIQIRNNKGDSILIDKIRINHQ